MIEISDSGQWDNSEGPGKVLHFCGDEGRHCNEVNIVEQVV